MIQIIFVLVIIIGSTGIINISQRLPRHPASELLPALAGQAELERHGAGPTRPGPSRPFV